MMWIIGVATCWLCVVAVSEGRYAVSAGGGGGAGYAASPQYQTQQTRFFPMKEIKKVEHTHLIAFQDPQSGEISNSPSDSFSGVGYGSNYANQPVNDGPYSNGNGASYGNGGSYGKGAAAQPGYASNYGSASGGNAGYGTNGGYSAAGYGQNGQNGQQQAQSGYGSQSAGGYGNQNVAGYGNQQTAGGYGNSANAGGYANAGGGARQGAQNYGLAQLQQQGGYQQGGYGNQGGNYGNQAYGQLPVASPRSGYAQPNPGFGQSALQSPQHAIARSGFNSGGSSHVFVGGDQQNKVSANALLGGNKAILIGEYDHNRPGAESNKKLDEDDYLYDHPIVFKR